jgi:hypothetical protein
VQTLPVSAGRPLLSASLRGSEVPLASLLVEVGRLTFWLVRRRVAFVRTPPLTQHDGQNRPDSAEYRREDCYMLSYDVHGPSMAL